MRVGSNGDVRAALVEALPKPGSHVVVRTHVGRRQRLWVATNGVIERIHEHGVLIRTRRWRLFVSYADLFCGDVEIGAPADVRRRIGEALTEIIRRLPRGERSLSMVDELSMAG